jgi:DNA-binding winged helix-turn-helix (wHTH) protein/tetratricopeptide (TPR) repeat protein
MTEQERTAANSNMPMAADFMLGNWLVQPSLNRTSRDGTQVHLRPQLMDVLVCLAQAGGRPVSRDELLDRVWPRQFVADTALARCVAELRQALGDQAQSPTIIETIPKRGYRLIAPLSDVPPGLGDATAAPPDPAVPDGPGLEPGTTPTAPAPPAPDLPPQARRRTARRLLGLVALSVVLVAAVAIAWELGWRAATPPLAERDPVVLTFTNTTGDPVFDGALRLALAIHLEQSPYLRVTSERSVQDTVRLLGQPTPAVVTPDLALQVCERIGAAAVISGSIAAMGQRYVIGLEAVGCPSRDTLARAQAEADRKEQVLDALARAANQLRRGVGESMASVGQFDVPLVEATTPSLEALRAVSQGDRAKYQGGDPEALTHYQRAVTLDPDFALAYTRIGVGYLNLRRRGEAVAPLTRAFELRSRVSEPERLYIEAHYYNGVLESPLRAIEAFSVLRRTPAMAASCLVNLASLYQQVGLWQESLGAAAEAVRLEPHNAIAHLVSAGALAGSGRFSEAFKVLDESAARGLQSPNTHDLRFALAFLTGNTQVMAEEETYAEREPAMSSFLLTRRARLAMFAGRLREARRLWTLVRADAEARRDETSASMALLSEAGSAALLGDGAGARRSLDAALQIDRSPSRVAQSALVMALASDTAASRRFLGEYERIVEPGTQRDLEFIVPARAALAVAEGRLAEVPALLEPIKAYELGTRFDYLPSFIRAHAWLGQGEYEEAARAFQVILDHRGVSPFSILHPLAWLGQARAYAGAGKPAEARRSLETFLTLWKDADADIALLARARREAAAVAAR